MNFVWFGHSAVLLKYRGKKIIVDPFVDEKMDADIICLTHGHSDRLESAVEIAERSGAEVVAIFELAKHLKARGVNATGMNLGGGVEIGGIRINMVDARHSSSIIGDGGIIYAGSPCGYVFELDKKVYHAGDTSLFRDMKSIRDLYEPEIGFLPAEGFYTMDEQQASTAAEWLGHSRIIPIHYNTFDALRTDLKRLKGVLGGRLVVPEIGKTYEL